MKSLYLRLFAGAGAAILLCSPSVLLATGIAPTLGAADSFGILGALGVTNTGATVVNGDLGISPNGLSSVTGFTFSTSPGPGVVTGTTHFADVLAGQAQADTTTAYNALASQACDSGPSAPTDLVGQTLFEGVYCFSSSVSNTGTLTLDAQNNSDAVWVFEIGSTLITGPGSSVVLTNGAQACNVFWQVGSSATLDTTTTFVGNILALTSITMNNGATLNGRALARNAAVTMDDNSVTVATCAATVTPTDTPTALPTETPTATETETPTQTPTQTVIGTPTDTPSATPTDTSTATETETSTQTPTQTVIGTPTDTPSVTPTDTLAATETETATQTPTQAVTGTPTDTPSATPTDTPSVTPSSTGTPTPLQTTPTVTPTTAATSSPTNTITPTGTPTSTSSATPTVTATPSATPTVRPTRTALPIPLIPTPSSGSGLFLLIGLGLSMAWMLRRSGRSIGS